MKNFKIKTATIARLAALVVALINQCLAVFGRGVIPFTENMAYQAVSLIAVIVIAAVNAWYNNDISQLALLCGGVFDALSDKKITEEEIEKMLADAENTEKVEEVKKTNPVVGLINVVLGTIKSKFQKK